MMKLLKDRQQSVERGTFLLSTSNNWILNLDRHHRLCSYHYPTYLYLVDERA